jgi:tetratricopeptide (TPR) repeat protein
MRLLKRLRMAFAQRLAPLLRKVWFRLAFLMAAAFLVHLPSLQGELIWDDNYLVGENPFFRSPIFSLEVFRHYLYLDSFSGHYRPVQNLSYILDYLIWNGDTYGYHFSNILWHAAAGALLFLLVRKLIAPLADTEQRRRHYESGAFLVALLWVLHPVHSAAVDYISGRADSLAFVFCSAAWLIYLQAVASQRIFVRAVSYPIAVFLLLLGLCAREIAFVWVAIFLIHLFFYRRGVPPRHRALALIICLSTLAAYAGLRDLPGHRAAALSAGTWDGVTRAGLILRSLGDYARLTIYPLNLHMERSVIDPRIFRSPATWSDHLALNPLSFAGLFAGAALIASALKRGRGQGLRTFGAIWFACGFVPISNLFDLNATSAEHWLYLPLAGLLLVFLGWMIELPAGAFRIATACALVFATALGVRSAIRSTDWLNAQVFYERTIAANGWSPRVGANLASIYESQDRLNEARKLIEQSLAAWPEYPIARSHLASILARQGLAEQSDRLMDATAAAAPAQRKEYPRIWTAALQLAYRKVEQHHDGEALSVLDAARQLEPNVWTLVALQAEILRRTRGPEAALPVIQKFTDDHWWQYPAFLALGKLKAQQGDATAALAALNHASRLDIHETEALNLVTRINLRAKNFTAALNAQERAISRQPDKPSQYLLFSEVLMQMGRTEQAHKALETARLIERQGRGSA